MRRHWKIPYCVYVKPMDFALVPAVAWRERHPQYRVVVVPPTLLVLRYTVDAIDETLAISRTLKLWTERPGDRRLGCRGAIALLH